MRRYRFLGADGLLWTMLMRVYLVTLCMIVRIVLLVGCLLRPDSEPFLVIIRTYHSEAL